jgi:hypothetical protein
MIVNTFFPERTSTRSAHNYFFPNEHRHAPPAIPQARDLRIELQTVLNDFVLTVRETAFTVSVQPDSASDKGRLVDEVLRGVRAQHVEEPCDFVFFCGAFGPDRAAFRRLAELEQDAVDRGTAPGALDVSADSIAPALGGAAAETLLSSDAQIFACRVGVDVDDDEPTDCATAPFYIESPKETRAILRRMLWASPGASSPWRGSQS